jgi:Protein of unknown function (DUF3618)
MGQSAEELRHEIAGTRENLGHTVDQISDQVSPARIVARRKERVRSRWASTKNSLVGNAADVRSSSGVVGTKVGQTPRMALEETQGRPMVAGAVAFGLGFLAAAVFPGSQSEGRLAQKVQDVAQPAVDHLKQTSQEAATALEEPARQAAQQVKDTATAGVSQVQAAAQDAAGDTKDAARHASQQVIEQAKQSGQTIQES